MVTAASTSRRIRGASLLAIFAVATWMHAAPTAKKPKFPLVSESTYAQRNEADPAGKAPRVDSLALPYPHALNILPGPTVTAAGKAPSRYPDLARIVWQYTSKVDAHDEYLRKRKELLPGKVSELIAWCERNRLPVCAEFELRAQLLRGGAAYDAMRGKWLRYAIKRHVSFNFPLPLEGEWMVIPDSTGHHRASHGAAFAYDLMIVRKNKQYHGDSRVLTNWYSFGQPILAQADGVVLRAEDRYVDPKPRVFGKRGESNTILIDYGGGVLGYYGHLKQNSLRVRKGDAVRTGDVIAAVGNSGHSRIPHLHVSFLDRAGFSIRGRYRIETSRTRGYWKLTTDADLKHGLYVRNPKGSD